MNAQTKITPKELRSLIERTRKLADETDGPLRRALSFTADFLSSEDRIAASKLTELYIDGETSIERLEGRMIDMSEITSEITVRPKQ